MAESTAVAVTAERKQNLETLPERMKGLPISPTGWVVPWFVAWVVPDATNELGWREVPQTEPGAVPEFRAMSSGKFVRAIKEKLCWVCGHKLGVNIVFTASGMCGINRTSSEPPCHLECARWSAQNCPFLTNPRMVRREDEVLNRETMAKNTAGFGITRNPGVAMLWRCRSYEVFKVDNGYLINMGEPDAVEWWAHGREATRQEVLDSIDSGLPILEAVARTEKGAMEALERARKRFERWIPNA